MCAWCCCGLRKPSFLSPPSSARPPPPVQPILDSAGRRAEEGRPVGAPTSEDTFPAQVMAVEQQQQQQVGPYAGVDIHLRGLAGAAEGFGSAAIGGLHGEVYHVTSLAGIFFVHSSSSFSSSSMLLLLLSNLVECRVTLLLQITNASASQSLYLPYCGEDHPKSFAFFICLEVCNGHVFFRDLTMCL